MTDLFSSCEITPTGVSIRVMRDGSPHRIALGIKDFPDRSAYIAAVSDLMESHLRAKLADVVAVAAADKVYGVAAIQALQDDHAAALAAQEAKHKATVTALQADLAALGTKEEAQAIRKQQEIATIEANIEAQTIQLSKIRAAMAKDTNAAR